MNTRELGELQHHLAHHLATMLRHGPVRTLDGKEEALTVAEWAPVVDIVEDDKQYLIKAELPEVTRANVKVTVQDDVLTITGERTFEQEANGKKYHRVERAYGRFARSFTVPENADGAGVVADYRDGVLNIHLPKSEKAKPKTIEVTIA